MLVACRVACLVWFGAWLLCCYVCCFLLRLKRIGIVNSVVGVAMYLCAPVQMFGLYVFFVGLVWGLLFSCLRFVGFGWLFSALVCKVVLRGCAVGLLIAWFGFVCLGGCV